jgi:hypothetical protein
MARLIDLTKNVPAKALALGTAGLAVLAAVAASIWLVNHPRTDSHNNAALAKVHQVQAQFPPGYQVTQTDTKVITAEYAQEQQAPMQGATFIPAECADQANAAQSEPVGATIEGLRGTSGDRLITVAAMETPNALPALPDMPQCDAVAFVQPGYIHGFTSIIGAPPVPDGIAAQGLRISATITDKNGQDIETVQFAYTATLDDHHVVAVTISGTPVPGQPRDIDPAPAEQLFTAAVEAMRTN